jgi:NAD(P)-dependent dehydrogenase (short-subunit alcohol dehydrogenase family)
MAAAKAELDAYGVQVTTQAIDVSDAGQVAAGYERVLADHGRIDCVIANSGLPSRNTSVLTMSDEDYPGLLAVNMHGAFYTLREGARAMVARAEAGEPGGSLVFCGSLSMFKGLVGKGNYAASKAGMGAMIRCMAVEFGKYGIRANSIAPGYIMTELTAEVLREHPDVVNEQWAKGAVMNRIGTVDELAGAVVYLAGDAASFTTGEIHTIDGGLTLR